MAIFANGELHDEEIYMDGYEFLFHLSSHEAVQVADPPQYLTASTQEVRGRTAELSCIVCRAQNPSALFPDPVSADWHQWEWSPQRQAAGHLLVPERKATRCR